MSESLAPIDPFATLLASLGYTTAVTESLSAALQTVIALNPGMQEISISKSADKKQRPVVTVGVLSDRQMSVYKIQLMAKSVNFKSIGDHNRHRIEIYSKQV